MLKFLLVINLIQSAISMAIESCETPSGNSGDCKSYSECPFYSQTLNFDVSTANWCDLDDEVVCCPGMKKKEIYYHDKTNINARKCAQWYELAYAKDEKCNPEGLISGGIKANPKELPFMALIGRQSADVWFCGGSLISPKYVLTAAHCVDSDEQLAVRLGELDYADKSADRSNIQDFKVNSIIFYDESNDTSHDIALIELDNEAEISDSVVPACLPVTTGNEYETLYAAGWGHLGQFEPLSSHLMKVALEPIDNPACGKQFNETVNLCFGSLTDRRDTCQGDSGSPLFTSHKEIPCGYLIFGVTSTGKGCGIPKAGATYMKILPYMPWIERTIYKEAIDLRFSGN